MFIKMPFQGLKEKRAADIREEEKRIVPLAGFHLTHTQE
jgi:hypothetical protein